jgi:hypothetical protein
MRRSLITLVLIGLTFTVPACASKSGATTDSPAQGATTLVVRNDSYLDYNVYLIQGSQRIRLGTARGLSSTRLGIPSQYVFGVSQLQFMADPIGGTQTPISERINVTAGDEIHLQIRG